MRGLTVAVVVDGVGLATLSMNLERERVGEVRHGLAVEGHLPRHHQRDGVSPLPLQGPGRRPPLARSAERNITIQPKVKATSRRQIRGLKNAGRTRCSNKLM